MLRIPSGSWSNKDKDSKRSESPEMPLTPPPSGHKRERTTSTISTTSSVEGSPGRSKGLSRRSSESVKKIVKGIKRKISFHKHKHHSLNPDCSYFRDQHSRDPSTSTTDELLLTPPPFDSEHADAVARKLKARQRSISIVDHSDDDDEYPSRRDQATSIDLDPKILLPSSPVMTPVAVAPSSSSSGAASPQPPPTVDISLPVSPAPTEQPTPTTAADVNKPVPVPPVVSPAPAQSPLVNLAALTAPSMFLPIPNTDPLSGLLVKHIPPAQRPARDVSGEWRGSDFHTLVMTNSWRSLANMARDRLVTSPPDDSQRIFDLWYLRLSSLARMRLFNHAAAECSSLLGALPPASVLPPNALPFELRVLAARILGRGLEDAPSASASPAPGDPQSVPGGLKDNAAGTSEGGGGPWGQVDALCALLKMCQRRAAPPRLRKANASASEAEDVEALQVAERERDMWRERGARVCMILASVLVDMKEYTTATRMLASLLPGQPPSNSSQSSTSPTATAALHSAIARVHLASGNVVAAEKHFALAYPSSSVEAEPEIAATGAQNEEPKEESPEGKDDGDNTALKVEHPRSASASPNPFVNPDLAPSRPESARPTPPPKSPQPSVASAGDEAAPDHPTPDVNAAIYASAMGDWVKAEGLWRRMPKTDVLATNNLAVALLAQGRITEAIQTLESALRSAPSSAVVAEPFLFNLATLYELHAHTALDKKRALLVETAKWAGDGLKAGCLKLSNA